MEPRHEMTAHIRKNRTVFFQIGLLTGLLVVFGAFKWTIYGENQLSFYNIPDDEIDSAIVINIIDDVPQDEPLEKEKLEPPTPFDPDHFKVVDDKTKIDTSALIVKREDDSNKFKGEEFKPIVDTTGPEEFLTPFEGIVEIMPTFPGGETEMIKYIYKNYHVPPILRETAKGNVKIQVKCVVEKDGSLSNYTVVKNGGYPEAAENLIKVLEKMPRWNPGYQGHRPVRVWVQIPLKIQLER